jgi:hypothetical protein
MAETEEASIAGVQETTKLMVVQLEHQPEYS